MSIASQPIAAFPIASVVLTISEPGEVVLFPARNIIDREPRTRRYSYSQNVGEAITYQVDMTRLMALRGVTITQVAWSSDQITIPEAQLSGQKARATLCPANEGTGLVKMTATQSDGNTRIVYIEIRGIDPECTGRDY